MLISVIIPVYNSEKYIRKCIDSILGQTYTKFEIILIDDGSSDESKKICREFSEKHNNISLYSTSNKGSANARNVGLERANGDYISFVDSDDWIDVCMYEKLVKALKINIVDIVSCDYTDYKISGLLINVNKYCREGLFDKVQIANEIFPNLIISSNLEQDRWPIPIVTKLYRREFLLENRLKFANDLRTGQDMLFSITALYKAASFYYLKNEYLYFYRENLKSRTHTHLEKSWDNYVSLNRNLSLLTTNNNDLSFSKQIELMKLQGVLSSIAYVFKAGNANNFIDNYNYIRSFSTSVDLSTSLSSLDWKRTSSRKIIYCLLLKYKLHLVLCVLTSIYYWTINKGNKLLESGEGGK